MVKQIDSACVQMGLIRNRQAAIDNYGLAVLLYMVKHCEDFRLTP